MNVRVGDVVHPLETRGDLIARGYSEQDANVAIAFSVWLRRGGGDEAGPDGAWARSELDSRAYLEQVAPGELTK